MFDPTSGATTLNSLNETYWLNTARDNVAVAVLVDTQTKIFAVGGCSNAQTCSTNALDTVEFIIVDSEDGNVKSKWSLTSALMNSPHYSHACSTWNVMNRLYVIGGQPNPTWVEFTDDGGTSWKDAPVLKESRTSVSFAKLFFLLLIPVLYVACW